MVGSEEQFKELIAQLIVRANHMLAQSNNVLPMGLALVESGKTEVVLASPDLSDEVSVLVQFIQDALTDKVKAGGIVATCVAYPEYSRKVVVAYLENNENYCLKAIIPVRFDDKKELVANEVTVLDGEVFIFPVVD